MSYDAVISNPPYSLKWRADAEQSITGYPLAPKSKADWQFVLEGVSQLDDGGVAVYVLPHGVLFRGGSEGKIRQRIIDDGYLDAVIGLPEKLFDVTGIPVCLLVLKKCAVAKDVLFIDASKDFTKGKNKNLLEPEHVNKIVEAYRKREDVDKYAHVVTLKEMQDNDYNLNIPRYVDTFEPEPTIPLGEIMRDMQETDKKIVETEGELAGMMSQLVAQTPEAQAEINEFAEYFGWKARTEGEQLSLL